MPDRVCFIHASRPRQPLWESKRTGVDLLKTYEMETGVRVIIYRFPNLFGKWCRPNYCSVVATFYHNLARGLPITVNDPSSELTLSYINDVVDEFRHVLDGQPAAEPTTHKATLGRIVELLESFRDSRVTLFVPDMSDPFIKKTSHDIPILPTMRLVVISP